MNAARLCRCCGARLRSGNAGIYCASCARSGPVVVPDGFYDSLELRAAVASYDFGTVFRAVRARTGLSQLHLAAVIGLSQSRISSVERGERRLRDVSLIARIAAALQIPGPLLGFHGSGTGSVAGEEVSWVDRRDFLNLVTAATLGSNLNPEIERLGTLLPSHAEPVSRHRIGDADIDAIEAITEGFRRSDFASGGLCRAAAVAQLEQVRRLDDALCSDDVRTRLQMATADLSWVAAWASWDVGDHDGGRRLWTFALDTARRVEQHPCSTDLAIGVLLDMAFQTLHLGRPREALRLAQLASATAINRAHPAGEMTHSHIASSLAYCWASLGEVEPFRRSTGEARERFVDADRNTDPPWVKHVQDAEMASMEAHATFLLSEREPSFAPVAIEQLRAVVEDGGLTYQRTRAFQLSDLAVAYFRAGDTESAVRGGYEAVAATSNLSYSLVHTRLRSVVAAAEPFANKSEVAELRDRIRTTRAAA